jgi:hypothetical protein
MSQKLRQMLTTAEAAKAIKRMPQTLRKWACLENGPIRPIRINGRLAWSLDEIAALLNGDVASRQTRGVH